MKNMNEITLYTAKSCPHCPAAKTVLEQFCLKHPDYSLRLVDVESVSSIDLLVIGISGTPSATLRGRIFFLSSMVPLTVEEIEREVGWDAK